MIRAARTALALLAAFTAASSPPVFAQEPPLASGGGSCGGGPDTAESAAGSLRRNFANYRFQEVRETPVAGLFEVNSEENTLYWVPASGHLIFGEIWDRDGRNLTAISREARNTKLVSTLPLDKAIKVGHGPKRVIEFSNPDCGHCRRASDFFAARRDVTRFVFLLDFGREATAAKVLRILAAADKAAAYEAAMTGKLDNMPAARETEAARTLQAEHRRIASRLGVKGTPQFWINGTRVSGADIKAIESLLR